MLAIAAWANGYGRIGRSSRFRCTVWPPSPNTAARFLLLHTGPPGSRGTRPLPHYPHTAASHLLKLQETLPAHSLQRPPRDSYAILPHRTRSSLDHAAPGPAHPDSESAGPSAPHSDGSSHGPPPPACPQPEHPCYPGCPPTPRAALPARSQTLAAEHAMLSRPCGRTASASARSADPTPRPGPPAPPHPRRPCAPTAGNPGPTRNSRRSNLSFRYGSSAGTSRALGRSCAKPNLTDARKPAVGPIRFCKADPPVRLANATHGPSGRSWLSATNCGWPWTEREPGPWVLLPALAASNRAGTCGAGRPGAKTGAARPGITG